PRGDGVPLVVVRHEINPCSDIRDILEKETARDGSGLDHTRETVAQIAGPSAPPLQLESHIETTSPPARDAVGKDDRGAEKDIRIRHVARASQPSGGADPGRRADRALDTRLERRLPLRFDVGAARSSVTSESRQLARL